MTALLTASLPGIGCVETVTLLLCHWANCASQELAEFLESGRLFLFPFVKF
jgi:hypothetical protein